MEEKKKQDRKLPALDLEHGADPTESETHAVDHPHEVHEIPETAAAVAVAASSKKQESSRNTTRWKTQTLLAIALAIGLAIFIPSIVLLTRKDDDSSKPASAGSLEDASPSASGDKEAPQVDVPPPTEEGEEDTPTSIMPEDGSETTPEEPEQQQPEEPAVPTPPSNDLCVNAQTITWDTISSLQDDAFLSSTSLTGTTALASILEEDYGYSRWNYDPNFGFADAGDLVDQEGRMCEWRSGTVGVWYKVMGRGMGIRASTCQQSTTQDDDSDNNNNNAPSLSVYQGSECGALNCVMNHPTNCGDGASSRGARNTLSWFGERDVTYYLYIQSSSSEPAGEFTLKMTEFATPTNDLCTGATPVEVDSTVEASAADALVEFISGDSVYDWEGDLLPGIFYDVVGTGNIIKLSAPCDEAGSSRIFVYQGDCDAKTLVGEKAICEPDSVAYFESVAGQTYHILFQTNSKQAKQLTISDEQKPTLNDMCLGALSLEPGTSIQGDTDDARFTLNFRRQRRGRNLLSVGPSGLYYSVMGTGKQMRVSIPCSGGSPTKWLEVFAGKCQYQERDYSFESTTSACEPDNSLTWQTQVGETYFLHVTPDFSAPGETGKFILSLDEVDGVETPPDVEDIESETGAPANDLCANAEVITWSSPAGELGSVTLAGTTSLSTTMEDLGYSRSDFDETFGFDYGFVDQEYRICSWRAGSTGVWYKVTGRGTGIRASTCDGSQDGSSMSNLSVYQGSDCQALNCVMNYPMGCGGQSGRNVLSWFGEPDVTYYIYVESASQGQGPVSLQVAEFATPSNDVCTGASKVAMGSTVSVSAADSTAEFINQGGSVHDWDGDVLPGVFYYVFGTGNVIKVAAPCDGDYTRIYAFEGPCESKRIVGEVASCEPGSEVYFESVAGQMYYILYQSRSGQSKQMTITEKSPALNDMCLGAKLLEPGTSMEGNTNDIRDTLYYRRRQLYSVEPSGLFYSVVGTGKAMRASTPYTEQGDSPVEIMDVFSGDCQELRLIFDTTIEMGEPEKSVTWQTQEGEIYHIKVLPSYPGGEFTLSLTEV